jgi:methyltransferase-like protein/cyclopropane fatty-acyl-phospholipid synthase-like methyltransferase
MSIVNPTGINSYDEVPYPSTSHVFTHPDNLATVATLLGLTPAPVTRCRVLELGCASGGNLIPMALELPDSTFVGIDASAVQIEDGNAAIAAVGCRNITLKQLDILDVTPELGQFDYILVHGIFSWVPVHVRDKILQICQQNLVPTGIAYISYNTYPGWHMLGNIRGMMLYHTRQVAEPRMRIAQARELLTFMTTSLVTASELSNSRLIKAYAGFLQSEAEHIGASTDSYVYHEELEEVNDPIYFHEFAAWAARHNLQYLSEANFSDVFLNDFPPQVTKDLLKLSHDLIELEQYMDFLRNRTFRKTLLVHQDVPISRQLRPDRIQQLCVASNARSASPDPNVQSIAVEEFSNPEGLKFATDHPVTKAALLYLAEIWPQAISFDTLLAQAYARLGQAAPTATTRAQDSQVLSANLLKGYAYSGRLIELHTWAPRFASQVSERPIASSWARFQIQSGPEVTNLCHTRAELKGIAQYVLSHLDGTHDRTELLAGLEKSVAAGTLILQAVDGDKTAPKPVADQAALDGEQVRHILTEELDEALQGLARAALLIA